MHKPLLSMAAPREASVCSARALLAILYSQTKT
jgi:hypothetical protein